MRFNSIPIPRAVYVYTGTTRASRADLIPINQGIFTSARSHTPIPNNVHAPTLQLSHTFRLYNSTLSSTHSTSPDASVVSRNYSTPIQEYDKLIEAGKLKSDDFQTQIIRKLQALHDALAVYDPSPPTATISLFSRLFSRPSPSAATLDKPRGLYLYGDVGTGKTMLMDIFYDTLPERITHKRRVHFHAFMLDVHKRMHTAKAAGAGDPLGPIARDLANEARVLCLDEFQVTDIADAMILRRLLDALLERGVVCVFTSNRHPDELYKNGIQRTSFLPAIDLLKAQFDVTDLDSGTDYRRVPRALSNTYFSPLDSATRSAIDAQFATLTEGIPVQSGKTIRLWGRDLTVPRSAGQVALFTFAELCGRPLGAADYLELTQRFGTLFVIDVPRMGLAEKDKARRFITFIDACYDSKTRLFVSSEVPIFEIFSDDSNAGLPASASDHMRAIMDELGLPPEVVGAASMFNGEEELFAFARCCSRLVEMGSAEWINPRGEETRVHGDISPLER
ncbi:AFG1-like ATPase-domain-containing protein [Russula earlei]|uniref:AFG1-like ATPase-domain-containing protein n=1 Tax=Russula earlei TaxID=71964 RepID=A0ACC0TZG6_9AGAM|nr:AFG1-like ATPase-domain-containing protein [Russula earlei]